jgi:CTD nuclear envelope phosphatase 1
MNSLNILSARVSPPQTPTASRSNSYGNVRPSVVAESRSESREDSDLNEKTEGTNKAIDAAIEDQFLHEETPLLSKEHSTYQSSEPLGWHTIPKAICMGLFDSMRWVLSTLAAPGVYLIACLYNERGSFAPFSQILKLGTALGGSRGTSQSQVQRNPPTKDGNIPGGRKIRKAPVRSAKVISSNSSSSGLSSESESEKDPMGNEEGQSSSTSPRTRSKSLQNSEEISPQRRSIRIKLHNEDSVRHRNHRKTQSTSTQSNGSGTISSTEISPATLKSPTSPAASLLMTKYPRAPAPPRPLIPRRQPSYAITDLPSPKPPMKTLILDLDETLIHSMAKGGRMGTGHMVEVKLNTIVGAGGNASIGPQHPVLYFVHKRPHCDDFLRRVSYTSYQGWDLLTIADL